MKRLILYFLIFPFILLAQVDQFKSIGIGGGGALFFPSLNPNNEHEVYISCDLSSMYHSDQDGLNWKLIDHRQIQGGNYSKVCFTKEDLIRYAISYKPDGYEDRAAPVKSVDGGKTWHKCPGNPDPYEFLDAIYSNYDSPQQIVISQKSQMYISQDGGDHFKLIYTSKKADLGLQSGGAFFDGNNIYIATLDGIVRSTDGGNSFSLWTTTGIPAGTGIVSFCGAKSGSTMRFFALAGKLNLLDGEDYNDLFVFDNLVSAVLSMDNASGNWTQMNSGIQFANHHGKFISMAENDINTVYIGGLQYANGDSQNRHPMILKTSNAGQLWTSVLKTLNNENIQTAYSGDRGDKGWWFGEFVLGMSVHPRNPEICYFSDLGFVHATFDGGSLWKQLYVNPSQSNPQNTLINKGTYYASNGDLNQVSAWQTYWADENTVWTCQSDINGTRSIDGGNNWSFDYTGHTDNSSYRMVSSNDKKTLYMATSSVHDLYQSTYLTDGLLDRASNTGEVKFSKDKGKTWTAMTQFSDVVATVAAHPKEDNTLYAARVNSNVGIGGIWQTKNANLGVSATWTKLPDPPRTEGHPYNIVVLNDGKILVSYSGHRDPAFTASSGVFLYDPSTNSWSDRSHPGMYYWTKDVIVDPHDPSQNTWYAGVFAGWGVSASKGVGGLYKTKDRGLNWTRIFDHERVESAAISPVNPNEMYVSTETGGLFYTAELNQSTPVFTLTDYPHRHPMRLFFHPYKTGELWITSFGQGVMIGTKKAPNAVIQKPEISPIQIFPNPGGASILVITKDKPGRIQIINALGEEMKIDTISKDENHFQLDVEKLTPGLYWIQCGKQCQAWIKK
ncbi:MAG: hypothetical protein IPQ10_08025 [Saprospiraceae bacterium]|nr:hypothetical protein [Saprospiraceae bacterium]MBK7795888.1 hypothetical protein [Saprospiraceae bacterium]MBL0261000.1 hypothetical protein [Saprospiraceae bacterium]